jgi:putative membrane protein
MKKGTRNSSIFRFAGPLAALVLAGGLTVFAQNGSSDEHFAKEAASGGQAEVKLGQLAQSNGQSDAVKSFGQRMVTDHSKANQELKQAAQKDGIQVDDTLSPKDQATYDRLAKLQGAEFDRVYARTMIQDHQQDIAEFQKEASDGQNQNVKEFARTALPTLREHLRLAQQMSQSVSKS